MGEIARGIARRRATDPGFGAELAAWLDQLLRLHHNRLDYLKPAILPLRRMAGFSLMGLPGG